MFIFIKCKIIICIANVTALTICWYKVFHFTKILTKKLKNKLYYIENDWPHPQTLEACGFLNSNPLPFNPSE